MRFLNLNHDTDPFRQETYLRSLNLEFENLELADIVESAQGATAALYKEWQDIEAQSRLSKLLSSANIRSEKKKKSEEAALELYFNQGERRNIDYWINLMWA